jgi:ABC-2 type transport system ATP-binding protein
VPEAAEWAVETRGLTKRFGDQFAVNSIDLSVPRGSVFGFLGPNGSGKTTTIRMLLGLIEPSLGEIELLGERLPKGLATALPRVGALVEGPAFYPYLSGEANLIRLDSASPHSTSADRKERVARAIERVGLTHAAKKKAHKYSLGMKQRLGIANALLMPRDLLVLDEPTNGLDPQGTREVRNLIRSLAADGTTILVSSHLLAEIEQLCSHVAVMSAGRIVAQGRLDELASAMATQLRLTTPDPQPAGDLLAELGLEAAAEQVAGDNWRLTAVVNADSLGADAIVAKLVAAGVRVRGFEIAEPSLEDRFVALTGEGFDVVQ